MLPDKFFEIMDRLASRLHKNIPLRFTSRMLSKSLAEVDKKGILGNIPALLTKMSTVPKRSRDSPKRRFTSSSSLTSVFTNLAFQPFDISSEQAF